MIEDIGELDEGATVRGDVCVIGTGPAGMEAIRYLRRNGLRVVVAEGGRRDFSKAMQELTRVENVGREVREPDPDCRLTPYLAPEHRGEGRLRQLGGNSNIWTGKWREFEPLDFEARPHVPMSGWPFGLEELRPIYREIERDYGFGDFAAAEATARPFAGRAGDRLSLSFHYWEAEPLRTARRHADELEADEGIRVVLGANAVELVEAEGGSIARLRCRSPEGREIGFEAADFVIATGGIEAPRLLLASTGRSQGGIGNARDLVGRCFQDHPKIKTGIFHPGPNFQLLPGGAANFPRPRFKAAVSLSPQVQAEHGLLNHTLQFAPLPPKPRPGLLERVRARLRPRSDTGSGPFKASFIFEQAPNPDSRVTLSDEHDALGMRKPRLDWCLTELDARAFERTLALLAEELARARVGRLEFPGGTPTIEDTVDCRHHIGTTRIGASPETGVVDPDARVWGTDNLWIASSAVFPTGHSYGPTLTILAVTRKACKAILRRRAEKAAAA